MRGNIWSCRVLGRKRPLGALLLGFSNCALCVADAVLETDGVMSVAGRPVFTPIVVVVILVVSMLIFTSVMFCVS